MFYKPTYCCHCGEKIERTEWLPWTSGRFCDVCDKEFKFQERLPKIFILLFTVFGIFGIGSYLKSVETTSQVAVKQNKVAFSENVRKIDLNENAAQNTNASVVLKSGSNISVSGNNNNVEKKKNEPAATEIEKVYFCGAETKKGNPCSRKVKGGGRCWQHSGREAILPAEKLLITQ